MPKAPSIAEKRFKVRESHEARLTEALRDIAAKQEASILRQVKKIMRAAETDIEKAYKLLEGFSVPLAEAEAETLHEGMLGGFEKARRLTRENILEARRKYDLLRKQGRLTVKALELGTEDPPEKKALGEEYRRISYGYGEWAKSVSGKRYSDVVDRSKSTIREAIEKGWRLKPTYRYQRTHEDGSKEWVSAALKNRPDVKRVMVTKGVIEELGKEMAGVEGYRLEMIARTELTRAFNHGTVSGSADDPFVKAFEFLGVRDDRQSPICEGLHGTIIDKNDPRLADYMPPKHPYCRSELVEVFITDNRTANIDTRPIIVDGEVYTAADFRTEFGKAGEGHKGFDKYARKQERTRLGIPESGFPVRSADDYRKAFVAGKDEWEWERAEPPRRPSKGYVAKGPENQPKKIESTEPPAKQKQPKPDPLKTKMPAGTMASVGEIEKEIAALQHERLYIIDDSGRVLYSANGGSNRVVMTKTAKDLSRGATTVHNHPNGTAFSETDVMAGILRGEKKAIVCTKKYQYHIEFEGALGMDPKEVMKIDDAFTKELKRIAPEFAAQIKAGEISYEDASIELSHRTLTKVAKQYKLKYWREAR